jgi:two-component system, sensor histidine kinase
MSPDTESVPQEDPERDNHTTTPEELFENLNKMGVRWFHDLMNNADNISVIISDIYSDPPRVLYFSKGAESLFGYNKDEIVGKPVTIFHVEEGQKMIPDALKRMNTGGKGFSGEHVLVKKDGSKFYGLFSTFPVLDENGHLKYGIGITQDLTSIKKLEKGAATENIRFRELIENLSDMIIEVDQEGTFTYASPQVKNILGYDPEDVIGLTSFDFIHEEDFETAAEKFLAVVRGEVVRDIEYRVKHKSGHYVHLSGSAKGQFIDDKFQMIANLRDITEKKRMEEFIQETGESYKSIIQSSPMGMLFYQLDEKEDLIFMGANKAAEKILDFSSSPIIGKNIYEVFPSLKETDIPDRFREAARDGIPWSTQQMNYDDGNISGTYEVYAYQTSPGKMTTSFLEISDRIRAQDEIKESHATLDSIFRAAPVGIGMAIDRVIQNANETLCRMLGYSQDELIGKNASFLYPTQEDFDFVGTEKYRQISEKGTGTVETRWVKKDGTIIDVLLSSTPIDVNDLSRGVTFTSLDITEMKRIQKEAIHEKNRASFYLDLMSHDIGNLHQGMATWAQIAQDDSFKPKTREEAMKKIGRLQSRSTRLLKSILLLSRLKGMDLHLIQTNLIEMIKETSDDIKNMFPEKEITIDLESCCDPCIIDSEPLMKEVFFNLFHNGVKFQDDEPYLKIILKQEGDIIRIMISDHGPGIHDKHKEELFQKYLSKQSGKRTGLGLSLVMELVERYEGTIEVKDRIKGDHTRGTMFMIRLPKNIVGGCS